MTDNFRDRYTDASQTGRPVNREDVMFELDYSPTTVGDEIVAGGWLRTTRPIGGEPCDIVISGTSGSDADDMQAPDNGYAGSA